jgi:hypothetical protein
MIRVLFSLSGILLICLSCAACGSGSGGDNLEADLQFYGYPAAGADAARGSRIFGIDPQTGLRLTNCTPGSGCPALFEGTADDGVTQIVSNSRTCADCHRTDANLQIGSKLPLNQHIPADDPLIRFVDADAQFNPDAPKNLNDHGLILIRPYRFKELAADDPFRKFTTWRKIPTNFNTAFAHGFVADLRNPGIQDVDKSASMTHTQLGDTVFNGIADPQRIEDLAAFQFSLFTDSRLQGLLHPGDPSYHPSYDELVADPFLTVVANTESEKRGKEVFRQFCFTCHNVPNVFNNRAQISPTLPAPTGQGYDIGIGEANAFHLDFRYFNPQTGQKEVVVLPLKKQNGEVVQFEVNQDIGLAAITGRWEDLYVFKVPQLRGLKKLAPYMHDNSIPDITALVHYFNSEQFNQSPGGRAFPIHMTPQQEEDLIAFLNNL